MSAFMFILLVDKEGGDVWRVIERREEKAREEGDATSCQTVLVVDYMVSSTTLDRKTVRFSLRNDCSGMAAVDPSRGTEGIKGRVLGDVCHRKVLQPLHRVLGLWGRDTVHDIN